jgi:hypothetical protein
LGTGTTEAAISTDDGDARGWDAIEAAVAQAVSDRSPLHWGTNTLPGQGGIYGVNAYRDGDHWLLVTFGLTDLYGPTSDGDGDVSGWGFELTMRVPRTHEQPPAWSLNLLDQLGRYVFSSGRPFEPGHRMDPGGPITGKPDTRLTALAFVEDPQLPPIASPYGRALFLTVVGITADELEQMKATGTRQVLDSLAADSPALVTNPAR